MLPRFLLKVYFMATLRTGNKRAKRKLEGIRGRFRRIAKHYRVKQFTLELNNSMDAPARFKCELVRKDTADAAPLSDEYVASLLCRSLGIVRTRALTDGSYCHTITAS
jgi:hypothetical protein